MTAAPGIAFEPTVPTLLAAAILGLAAIAAWYGSCGAGSTGSRIVTLCLRGFALALLGFLLAGPKFRNPQPARTTEARPTLAVLLDASASMQREEADGETRMQAAWTQWFAPAVRDQLEAVADVRAFSFGDRLQPLGRSMPDANGTQSDHLAALQQLLAANPSQTEYDAVWIIGDGHERAGTRASELASAARAGGVSVFASPVGSTHRRRDLAVEATLERPWLLPGESTWLLVRVHHTAAANEQATVTVTLGEQRFEQPIRFDEADPAVARFTLHPRGEGHQAVVVSAEPIRGETRTDNNRRTLFLEVADKPLELLLIEGEPHWQSRALLRRWRSDPRVRVSALLQLGPNRLQWVQPDGGDVDQPLKQIGRYDIVVLGRHVDRILDDRFLAGLDAWVSIGGGLLLARGRPVDPDTLAGRRLAPLFRTLETVRWARATPLPVKGASLKVTPSGRTHPILALGYDEALPEQLQHLLGTTPLPAIESLLPAAVPLLEADLGPDREPLLLAMPYGRGRVVQARVGDLWLGPLEPESKQNPRQRLSASVLRHLAGSSARQGYTLEIDRLDAAKGSELHFEVNGPLDTEVTEPIRLHLLDPAGQQRPVELEQLSRRPLRYRGRFTPQATGSWEAELFAGNERVYSRPFAVHALDLERLHDEAMPAFLRSVAEATGGSLLRDGDIEPLAGALKRAAPAEKASTPPPPSTAHPWLLLCVLGLLCGEWLVRRTGGLDR